MSFTGDLEHLSIVDVVQLLHSTRKSGTLTIRCGKGECQIVFDDGYIISANHFDNNLRIGRILVEAKVLSEESLNTALREQAAAGKARRPLVAMLIESGRVKKEDAYRGLETLLELTIVEVLTWKTGSFTLDVGVVAAADDYRYFPEKLQQEIQFHTENVLMDALRIYDEKNRDGTLGEFELTEDLLVHEPQAGAAGGGICADDLGLADVETMQRKIPSVFTPLEDRPLSANRSALDRVASAMAPEERERLAAFLDDRATRKRAAADPPLFAVLYGGDELLSHCLGALCRHEGILLFSTNEENDIEPVLEQCRAKGGAPVLVLDAPSAADPRFSPEALTGLSRRLRERHRDLSTLQLAGRGGFPLPEAAGFDVVSVLSRPLGRENPASFVADFTAFLKAFPSCLRAYAQERRGWCVTGAARHLEQLRGLKEAQGVPLCLLTALAGTCERALTLIVRGSDLFAERGVGFVIAGGAAAATAREARALSGPPLKLAIGGSALLTDVVGTGRCRHVPAEEPGLAPLWARIGAPRHPFALLLPLRAGGRTVTLTYADFGQDEPVPVDFGQLELYAAQAGLALEAILLRRKGEKAAPRENTPPNDRQAEGPPWT